MAQRIRPLLLLKKQLGAYQRVGANVYGIGNRLVGKGFRATQIQAEVGSDDVTVFFNEDVVVTDPASGVSITVNGQAATFTAVKGPTRMVYTLTSQNPLDYDDVIVWTYDSAAAGADPYIGEDSGEELADSTLSVRLPPMPVPPAVFSVVALNQDTIVVIFTKPVSGSSSLGIAWTGLTDTPTAPDANNVSQIEYTLGPADAGNIYDSTVITWQYTEALGDLVAVDNGEPLRDAGPITVDVSGLPAAPGDPPVNAVAGWSGNENCV